MIPALIQPSLNAALPAARLEKALHELAKAGQGANLDRIADAALAVRTHADDLASAASDVFAKAEALRAAEAEPSFVRRVVR
jgi:hypothetical protein